MKLPEGMFDPGRRFTSEDVPAVRQMRQVYRQILLAAEAESKAETKLPALLALARIKAELLAKVDACGELLARLERLPPGRLL